MSLLQKYRKEETRKTSPEEELDEKKQEEKKSKQPEKKPIAPKQKEEKDKEESEKGKRNRPVISATVSSELVNALTDLTNEKYLNRSKFIEDALKRTIKVEFPEIAKRYGF
ncbi:MAG: hypothetical protein GF308_15500 [Candidatus Heimdallarchaeota archaeon]|nr:hypothetical protein [Candidatus Heimdallarchaeota archaeon]